MIKRRTNAKLLNNKIYLTVFQGTESVPAPTDKIIQVEITDDICLIGAKVVETLDLFLFSNIRFGREDWKLVYKPLLKITGLKTEKKLFDSVKMVDIYSRGSTLTVVPIRNTGWKNKETRPMDNHSLSGDLNKLSTCEIGEMVIKAFEISTLELNPKV